jgi:hypothetical protein
MTIIMQFHGALQLLDSSRKQNSELVQAGAVTKKKKTLPSQQ